MSAQKTQNGLTPQEETFAAGLARGLTQAEAYREAYPKSRDWKDRTVWTRASGLAANSEVKRRVAELTQHAAAENGVTVERWMQELCRIAFGDARRVMSWGPDGVVMRDSSDLTEDEAAIVSEAVQTTTMGGGSIKIKTHDKMKALEMIGKSMGLFVEKHEVTGAGGKDLFASFMTELQGNGLKPGGWDENT